MTASRHSAEPEPVSAEPMNGSAAPTPWDWVRGHLRRSTATYWLVTVRPNGAPHVMPVPAVWVEGRPYVSMGPGTRKARNLARDARCVVTVEYESLDLVVEGTAVKVRAGCPGILVAVTLLSILRTRVAPDHYAPDQAVTPQRRSR